MENFKEVNSEQNKITQEIPTDEEIIKYRNRVIAFLFGIIVLVIISLMTVPTKMHKPAIYLYPEETTAITVKLDKSIKTDITIPKYKNGWHVLADNESNIKDLQRKYTKCDKLPYKQFGFEYSLEACKSNIYPYIYWDGVQLTKPVPVKEEGFIVHKKELEKFLNDKADEMKFIESEKKEFVRYWTKVALDRNWKKYKIYFLQNEEVDEYFKLYVNPIPKNSNRVQIVISKAKKNEQLPPQTLKPFIREGYTLVEWGGIIKN